MEVPKSLQSVWTKSTQDGNISADDYKNIVKEAVPTGKIEELDADEEKFITALKSQLENNGIAKGAVPVGVLNFGENAQVQTVTTENGPSEANDAANENMTAKTSENTEVKQASLSFQIPEPNLPQTSILLNWPGYNKQVNTAFSDAFGEKKPSGNQVPVLSNAKADNIVSTLGFGSVSQLQQMVGAKQDNKFGPETYFRAKAHVATEINGSTDIDKLTKLKSVLDVLGKDAEVGQMKTIVDQRIQGMQEYLSTRQALEGFFNSVNTIVGSANPKDMNSLVQAKASLQTELDKLKPQLKEMPQVKEAFAQANAMIDEAIKKLQNDLALNEIAQQKNQLVGELNGVVNNAIKAGLTTGDVNKVKEGKTQVDATVNKYPKVKDMDDVKAVTKQAHDALDATITKLEAINALIAKKDWTPEDKATADKFMAELPDGDLKSKLGKAIEGQSEAAKLKEKNRGNLKTTREGLHDVIGNGFWNLENKEGAKGMFQLVAKQGLLGEAITKMNVDDQTEAIKVLTKDIKFDKMSDGDKFNLAIAKNIYENLSKSADVDDEIKKKTLPHLKKETLVTDFSAFSVDNKTYVKGLKEAISSDTLFGKEQEAALTMARGIINGEVSKSILGDLNRYELNDLTKFIEKKGSVDERNYFLGTTVANAYNEGVAVNIESLDKGEKAKVIKGVMDIPDVNEGKISDLFKKAGKNTVMETVKNENLSDKQLSIVGKHVNGDDMADEPAVGSKILVGMIKQYNKQEDKSPVQIGDIRKYIDEVDKDWWEDDDTMKLVISGLGDGPGSEYEKFQKLAPATLDKVWKISD